MPLHDPVLISGPTAADRLFAAAGDITGRLAVGSLDAGYGHIVGFRPSGCLLAVRPAQLFPVSSRDSSPYFPMCLTSSSWHSAYGQAAVRNVFCLRCLARLHVGVGLEIALLARWQAASLLGEASHTQRTWTAVSALSACSQSQQTPPVCSSWDRRTVILSTALWSATRVACIRAVFEAREIGLQLSAVRAPAATTSESPENQGLLYYMYHFALSALGGTHAGTWFVSGFVA